MNFLASVFVSFLKHTLKDFKSVNQSRTENLESRCFYNIPTVWLSGEQLTLPWLPCDDNNVYIAYVLKANQAILPSVYSMKLYMRIFRFKTKSICLILVYLS